jgi:hypothetical protein
MYTTICWVSTNFFQLPTFFERRSRRPRNPSTISAVPDDRPSRVDEPLGRLLRRIDPRQQFRVYRVWKFWAEEVGEAIAAQAQPAGFHAGVLSVRVTTHAWMQELQFHKEVIRERLNARLGGTLIRDIYFVSGLTISRRDVDPPAEPIESEPEPALPPLPPLRDPQLASVFGNLVRAHAHRHQRRR